MNLQLLLLCRTPGGVGQDPGGHSRNVESKPLAQGEGEGMGTEGDQALLPSLVTTQWAFWKCCEPRWACHVEELEGWASWATCPRAPRGSVDVRDHWKPQGHPAARQDPGRSLRGEEWCHSSAPQACSE